MSHASNSQPEVNVESFWQKGFTTLRSATPGTLYISFLAFVLPQIIYELVFARQSAELVEISKVFAARVGRIDFYDLLQPAATYATELMAASALVWLIHLSGYFSIVHVCHCIATGRAHPRMGEALAQGFKLTIRRGMVAVLLFAILFFFVQVLMPPAILALLPGLMIPVLIVTGTTGVIQPILQALKMTYGERYPGGKWPLFFQLMSLGAFFYAGVLLVVFLSNQLLVIDTWLNLPRGLWITSIGGLPISPMYLLGLIFKLVCMSFICCFLAAISVTFFTWVRRLPRAGVAA